MQKSKTVLLALEQHYDEGHDDHLRVLHRIVRRVICRVHDRPQARAMDLVRHARETLALPGLRSRAQAVAQHTRRLLPRADGALRLLRCTNSGAAADARNRLRHRRRAYLVPGPKLVLTEA